jgi:hypothetical protein
VLYDDLREWWIRHKARRLGPTEIDRVGDGARVKVVGRVDVGARPLEAPITGRPCAAWSVEVQDGANWSTVVIEVQAQDFVLRDRSSRSALVRADQASVVFDSDAWIWQKEVTPRMRAFLDRYRLRDGGYFGTGGPFRYVEGVIEAGEEVTVVGNARLEIDETGSTATYREPAMRVVLDAARRAPLYVLDGPARWRLG